MSAPGRAGYIVGSYATSPNLYALEHPNSGLSYQPAAEKAFYDGLAAIDGCAGLEVQFDGKAMHCFDEATFLSEYADPKWKAVLTCIGGTMGNIGRNPKFGLASTDPAGRAEAIEFAKAALAAVKRWNARPPSKAGGSAGKVIAVEIHSAPNSTIPGAVASVDAFSESLTELLSWDWDGAELIVEHCDAPGQHPAAKGFLSLDDELTAVAKAKSSVSGAAGRIGVCINWARSVLETRKVDTAVEHISKAAAAGALRGLMFSGCTPESGPYGPWRDCHMPPPPGPNGINPIGASGSLMTVQAIQAAIRAAPAEQLLFSGCKITSLATGHWVGDTTDDTPTRVGLNAALLEIIDSAFDIKE